MERRRFVPSTEGLEGRAVLSSLFGSSSSAQSMLNPYTNLPINYQQKTLRIDRLPVYLAGVQDGRVLPKDTVAQLQSDLSDIRGKLHAASSPVINTFNVTVRDIGQEGSITVPDANKLNRSFGAVLASAGATPGQVQALQADMTDLVKSDSFSRSPLFYAVNDYSIVLQTALDVGLPIRTPTAPRLAASTDTGAKGDNTTAITRPTLVGTYDYNSTMQVIDEAGVVLGQGTTGTAQTYSIPLTQPLSVGTHVLRVQGIDPAGDVSKPSPPLVLHIVPPAVRPAGTVHPQGPLALWGKAT